MRFLETLNAEQRAAVTAPVCPILVRAGAGSGKTRVLTYRIAYLIEQHKVEPTSILAVTFTNKAADELRSRLRELLGARTRNIPTAGTFHAICAKLLRKEIEGRVGHYTAAFSIYAGDEQVQLIQEAMDRHTGSKPPAILEPWDVLNRISRFKSRMQTPQVALRSTGGDPVDAYAAQIYRAYQKGLERANAMDFDDLIRLAYQLLFQHEEVLEQVQARWRHVLVDEYQDTDPSQYALLELLTRPLDGRPRSLFAVGDAMQSIYGFRNADYTIITRFARNFENAQVVDLATNYRSRQEILDAAYAVIRHSRAVPPMALTAARAYPRTSPPLVIFPAKDEREEAREVARQAKALTSEGRKLSQIAVLYRSKHMSRALEEALRTARLPYAIKGSQSFYDRRVVRDAMSYLRAVANPPDTLSLSRIINTPARGIGQATLAHLSARAAEMARPLGEAIMQREAHAGLPDKAAAASSNFARMLHRWRELARQSFPPEKLLHIVLEESGYRRWILESWEEEEKADAIEHLAELETAAAEHEDIASFLQQVALITNVDKKEEREAIQLLTIHAAKGLEWPVVFIVGLEEGTLPHKHSVAEASGVEEERRLCYVALTRAAERLYLSHAAARGRERGKPSRFLDEILAYGKERAAGRK